MVLSTQVADSGNTDQWGDYIPKIEPQQDKTTIHSYWLNQFCPLKISGPDAEKFLQGQLTCNLKEINTETVHYGACSNAKGRIVANFIISFDGEHYWLILPTESAKILEKHLQKYKVFFKADIENCLHSHKVFGLYDSSSPWQKALSAEHQGGLHSLTLTAERKILLLANDQEVELINLSPSLEWRLMDIQQGSLFIEAEQSESWLPQQINWHMLNGISFNKGCYTGQEIIARLQYLGKAKKALFHFSLFLEPGSSPITHISQLYDAQGRSQGDVLQSRVTAMNEGFEWHLLAVIATDCCEQPLFLTDSAEFPLTLQNLSYTEEKTV
jgi:folate-binding protein YgfZ